MRRWILSLAILGLTVLLPVGCAKKKPVTAPEATDHEETRTAPTASTAESAAAETEPADPAEVDPLLSGDLEAANAYARQKGLLDDVHFAYDSSQLTDQGRQRLVDNADFLRRYSRFQAVVEGHCDERGTPEYNLALGEQRAGSARDYLASLGVDAARLRTVSYGKERPVCSDRDEACWWRNRRAHFLLTGQLHSD